MKIIHVFHNYYPVVGGLERAVQSLAEELAKMGHEVRVITSRLGAGNRPKEEVINKVYVRRVKALRPRFSDLTIPVDLPKRILKDADIIICWSQNSYFTYKICKYAKEIGKKLVVYFIGVDYLEHHYDALIRVLGRLYQKLITRKMVNLADVALVTNNYERKLLKERYSVDSIVLPHGIDDAYLKLHNMADNFRKKYGIEGNIVAFIGRIHPTKGLDLLIKAFTGVAMKMPNTVLVIAGSRDEKYLEKCVRLAERLGVKERVKYVGRISEEDKIALIDASDIIVLSTRHAGESYPLLINEVLARGKRLIVTRGSIASKWIEESGIARVVNADPRDLAQAIIDELKLESDSATSTRKAVEIPTWRDVAYRLLELSQRILNERTLTRR
jgi:glycosyltransferase involved in cell wall biosynthesis